MNDEINLRRISVFPLIFTLFISVHRLFKSVVHHLDLYLPILVYCWQNPFSTGCTMVQSLVHTCVPISPMLSCNCLLVDQLSHSYRPTKWSHKLVPLIESNISSKAVSLSFHCFTVSFSASFASPAESVYADSDGIVASPVSSFLYPFRFARAKNFRDHIFQSLLLPENSITLMLFSPKELLYSCRN